MPIYEFKCQSCGMVFESFFRSMPEKIDLSCPSCRSKQLKKIFSTPSLVSAKNPSTKGLTCCGRQERCETPPCSDDKTCQRD